jgi:ankyrin repeat protein
MSFPLHRAVIDDDHAAFQLVLQQYIENNISLDTKDKRGNTALHYAVYFHRVHFARKLLKAGADPMLLDAARWSALKVRIANVLSNSRRQLAIAGKSKQLLVRLQHRVDLELERKLETKLPSILERLSQVCPTHSAV